MSARGVCSRSGHRNNLAPVTGLALLWGPIAVWNLHQRLADMQVFFTPGAQVVIENSGGGTVIDTAAVIKAASDGIRCSSPIRPWLPILRSKGGLGHVIQSIWQVRIPETEVRLRRLRAAMHALTGSAAQEPSEAMRC